MQRIGQRVLPVSRACSFREPRQQQTEHAELFVERRVAQLGGAYLFPCAVCDFVYAVDLAVFRVKLKVIREIRRDLRQLKILLDDLTVYRNAERFAGLHHFRQILPAARGDELNAVRRRFHAVEIVAPDFQIGQDRAVNAAFSGVFLPDAEILLDVDFLDAVERHNVKFAHGFVIFGRIACRHDHPALRKLLIAEGLALQELKHHRRQRFRNAVDLVEEQNALGNARALDLAVD